MSQLFSDFRESNFFYLLAVSSHASLAIVKILVMTVGSIPVWAQLLPSALSCIFIGSLLSVIDPTSEEAQDVERMKPKDAYMFPVFGSATLFSFYLCIKYLPKNMLEILTRLVFAVVGALAMQQYFDTLCQTFFQSFVHNLSTTVVCSFDVDWKILLSLPYDIVLQIPIPQNFSCGGGRDGEEKDEEESQKDDESSDDKSDDQRKNLQAIVFHQLDLVTGPLGLAVSLWWYFSQHWIANNLIGESFCMQAIALLNPGSFFTAAVLLGLLFVYDIFWVFGTEVMVTVAKGLKAPIKLIFPRGGDLTPSALGLGDIVLPGIYLALLLRYDVVQKKRGSQPQVFWVGVICYVLSLAICLLVMFYFDHAQPALLYISPGVTLPIMGYALVKGEFSDLWAYEEEEEHAKQG